MSKNNKNKKPAPKPMKSIPSAVLAAQIPVPSIDDMDLPQETEVWAGWNDPAPDGGPNIKDTLRMMVNAAARLEKVVAIPNVPHSIVAQAAELVAKRAARIQEIAEKAEEAALAAHPEPDDAPIKMRKDGWTMRPADGGLDLRQSWYAAKKTAEDLQRVGDIPNIPFSVVEDSAKEAAASAARVSVLARVACDAEREEMLAFVASQK